MCRYIYVVYICIYIGVVFKETGCYMDKSAMTTPRRLQCFPYIASHAHTGSSNSSNSNKILPEVSPYYPPGIFGDGTVTYVTKQYAPANIYL